MAETSAEVIYYTIVTIISVAGSVWSVVRWQARRAEQKAAELRKVEENKAAALKKYADDRHNELVAKLGDMNTRITGMVDDLRRRADLTNGNVAAIRMDISDLQEDVLDLFENSQEPPSVKERRRTELERKRRRRQIERDRITQSEREWERNY